MLGTLAQAQTAGTITFTAKQASATGSLAPVLTWSTTPVASSCTAGGAWSGTKFASGTETLATITASKSYTLTCVWGNGSASLNWTAPTKNTDGTSLTDLAGYKVVFGSSATRTEPERVDQRSQRDEHDCAGAGVRDLVHGGTLGEFQTG